MDKLDKLDKLILLARETQLMLARNEVNDVLDKQIEQIRRQIQELEQKDV